MHDLLDEFLYESFEGLDALDGELARLEHRPDDVEAIARIFRILHTIKGTCGFLGLARLERLIHAVESLLGHLRGRSLSVTPELITLVLHALDRIRAILAGLQTERQEPAGDDAELIARLERAGDGQPSMPPKQRPPSAPTDDAGYREPGRRSLRVAVEAIEELDALVGELALARDELVSVAGEPGQGPLAAPLERLGRVVVGLQDRMLATRMQPIGRAWSRLPRLARDLGEALGKRIELTMAGAETVVDYRLIELLRAPLTHMVRNAADHGIEPPRERRRAGRPECGTIALAARHDGGRVVIEVRDDGRGLDMDAITASALALGLVTKAGLARLKPAQIHRLALAPGVSTVRRVTSVSGRGVGLDAARADIERIGGSIEIASTRGQGTVVEVRCPLTLETAPTIHGARQALPQPGAVDLLPAGAA